jgi:hypothetical protein
VTRRPLKEIQREQREARRRRKALNEGMIQGLLYARESTMKADGMPVRAAHNLAAIIDSKIKELLGPEFV